MAPSSDPDLIKLGLNWGMDLFGMGDVPPPPNQPSAPCVQRVQDELELVPIAQSILGISKCLHGPLQASVPCQTLDLQSFSVKLPIPIIHTELPGLFPCCAT